MASTQALILDIFGIFIAGYFACNKQVPSNQILSPFLDVGWLTIKHITKLLQYSAQAFQSSLPVSMVTRVSVDAYQPYRMKWL